MSCEKGKDLFEVDEMKKANLLFAAPNGKIFASLVMLEGSQEKVIDMANLLQLEGKKMWTDLFLSK